MTDIFREQEREFTPPAKLWAACFIVVYVVGVFTGACGAIAYLRTFGG